MPLKLSPTQAAFNARGDGKFNQAFAEQLAFFRDKLNLPTQAYDDILGAAHDRAFVVAGAMKADLLNDFRASIDKAIAEGKSIQWFRSEFKHITEKHGWLDYTGSETKKGRNWRTRIIYRTNLASSYAAGRYHQLTDPELLKRRPYWKYIHNDSVQHPRPLHVSWSGLVLKHDDPWWNTHFPPNGWGCRCRVKAVTASDYNNASAPDDGEKTQIDRAGNAHTLPKGIDFGWDYAPGQSLGSSELRQVIIEKSKTLPKPIADDLINDVLYWQKGTEQAKWHGQSFTDSPEYLKHAIKKYDDLFSGLIPRNKNQGAYYFLRKIHMADYQLESYHGQGVWRHEYGHFLDFEMGSKSQRSLENDFVDLLATETRQVLKNAGYGRKSRSTEKIKSEIARKHEAIKTDLLERDTQQRQQYVEKLAKQSEIALDKIDRFIERETAIETKGVDFDISRARLIQAIQDSDAASLMQALSRDLYINHETYKKGLIGKFSDLIGSATKNKLLGHGPHGNGGHSNSYYKQGKGYKETEVFANLTALLGANDPVWDLIISNFYPELSNLFIRILKDD